jgi:2,3-bisphosphoglycerate-independent phosphoglycerate mutase
LVVLCTQPFFFFMIIGIVIHTKEIMKTPTVLIILDGFGLAPVTQIGNAITPETAPHMFGYMKEYPSTEVLAHGAAVGLANGQQGNSEAGHFNIGAGRVVEQDLMRIWRSVADGTFFKNESFKQGLLHAQETGGNIHVLGLLTGDQSAHADPNHLIALLDYFKRNYFDRVYLHLFTDGRDSSPHSALTHYSALKPYLMHEHQVVTLGGRFYGMDRNKLWERTELAYDQMLCGTAAYRAESVEAAIEQAYNRGETDEYITPTIVRPVGSPSVTIKDGDSVFFYNARSDRARQLTKAFVQPDFETKNPGAFSRCRVLNNLKFVAMTDFGPDLPGVLTAFPSPDITHGLTDTVGEYYSQLYISETEKYAHVTYFLNGGFPEPVHGEDRELVRSPDQYSYADFPEMKSADVVAKVLDAIDHKTHDVIIVNIPNADMVGHTGNFEAGKRAVRAADWAVHEIVERVLAHDGQVLITADHGNAEQMIHPSTHEIMTEHTTNPVPCIYISAHPKSTRLADHGKLADIAPTLLDMLDIPKPKEMTGSSLLES